MNEKMEKERNKKFQKRFIPLSKRISEATWGFKGICNDALNWGKGTIFCF
jgi:hypothetical protein